jgi:hypothetical protein
MIKTVEHTMNFAFGMPVMAGISDTLQIEGKVNGCCSREYKDAFLKDPKGKLVKQ